MKAIKNYLPAAALALLSLVVSNINAQTKTPQQFIPFTIDINAADNNISLTCNKGCEWKMLSFSTKSEQTQWIDASGKTQNASQIINKKGVSPFKISFQKVGDKLVLKSTSGTVWEKIPLNANARFTMQINEFGFVQ